MTPRGTHRHNIAPIYGNAGVAAPGIAPPRWRSSPRRTLRPEAQGAIKVTVVRPTGVRHSLAPAVVGRRRRRPAARCHNAGKVSQRFAGLEPSSWIPTTSGTGDHPTGTGGSGRLRHRPTGGHRHQRHRSFATGEDYASIDRRRPTGSAPGGRCPAAAVSVVTCPPTAMGDGV